MLTLSQVRVMSLLVGGLIWLGGCTNTGSEVNSQADEVEQSANPTVFLSGTYRLDKLDLSDGTGESEPSLISQYELVVRAVGDSLQLTLAGSGKAGRYNNLRLGTYGVTPNANNLATASVGNRYGYELRRAGSQKAYITFSRVPYVDKTTYSALLNLYRIGYGLDKNKGAIIADESYSIEPSYNERIATLRLARTSPGVWRAK